jgi:hypothetical protein
MEVIIICSKFLIFTVNKTKQVIQPHLSRLSEVQLNMVQINEILQYFCLE